MHKLEQYLLKTVSYNTLAFMSNFWIEPERANDFEPNGRLRPRSDPRGRSASLVQREVRARIGRT